jgi:hypothetical protein
VPLSLAWTGERIVIALEPRSRTARNLTQNSQARLALGPTRDLVMIDAEVEKVTAATELEDSTGEAYVGQVGWDPRREPDPYVHITFRPVRVQAWREAKRARWAHADEARHLGGLIWTWSGSVWVKGAATGGWRLVRLRCGVASRLCAASLLRLLSFEIPLTNMMKVLDLVGRMY